MLLLSFVAKSYLHVVKYVLQPPIQCLFVIPENNMSILLTYYENLKFPIIWVNFNNI